MDISGLEALRQTMQTKFRAERGVQKNAQLTLVGVLSGKFCGAHTLLSTNGSTTHPFLAHQLATGVLFWALGANTGQEGPRAASPYVPGSLV